MVEKTCAQRRKLRDDISTIHRNRRRVSRRRDEVPHSTNASHLQTAQPNWDEVFRHVVLWRQLHSNHNNHSFSKLEFGGIIFLVYCLCLSYINRCLYFFFLGEAILQNLWDYLSQTTFRTLLNTENSSFPYKIFQLTDDEVEPWDLHFKQVVPEDFHGCLEYMQKSLVIKLPYPCNTYSQTK